MTLPGVIASGQSGPGSNGNEGVHHTLQSSSITGTSPSDCLVLYPGNSDDWARNPIEPQKYF